MNSAEYLVSKLEEIGVEYIFGYPGEQVLPIYEAIRKSSIEHILVRHEQAAIHAADSYARVSGKLGVCLATAGPGAMNLVMGTSACFKDNVPVLVITGDVSSDIKGMDTFQDIDINGVFEPITYKSYYCNSPDKLQRSLNEIISIYNSGITSPYHINISKDVQNKVLDIDDEIIENEIIKKPSESSIQEVIKLIDNSKRPLIIVGSGIIYADAICELKEFIEKTKIPLTTTHPARGVISEKSTKNIGLIGNRGTLKANYASENADLIIALATRLSERTTSHINTENIVQINTNKNQNHAKYFYNYNVKEFLSKINKEEIKETDKQWLNDVNSYGIYPKRIIEECDKLHPEEVLKTIIKHVDKNITISMDAGKIPTYLTIDFIQEKHSQVLFSGGLGPMGYSIPSSIGASYARGNDVILAITGDGSSQMTIEELATIKEYQLPIIIIIIDNKLLGIIKQWQDMASIPTYQVELENPDFIKLAEAYSINAKHVDSLEELNKTLEKAINEKKPYLIHVEVDDIPIPLP